MRNDVEALALFLASTLPRLARRVRDDAVAQPPLRKKPEWNEVVALRSASGQMTALGTVVNGPGIAMRRLARQMGVTPATATAMVKRLVAGGYVERQGDENDWRVVCVLPTEKGSRVFNYYLDLRGNAMRKRLKRLSSDQLQALSLAVPALCGLLD